MFPKHYRQVFQAIKGAGKIILLSPNVQVNQFLCFWYALEFMHSI